MTDLVRPPEGWPQCDGCNRDAVHQCHDGFFCDEHFDLVEANPIRVVPNSAETARCDLCNRHTDGKRPNCCTLCNSPGSRPGRRLHTVACAIRQMSHAGSNGATPSPTAVPRLSASIEFARKIDHVNSERSVSVSLDADVSAGEIEDLGAAILLFLHERGALPAAMRHYARNLTVAPTFATR